MGIYFGELFHVKSRVYFATMILNFIWDKIWLMYDYVTVQNEDETWNKHDLPNTSIDVLQK